MRKRIVKTKAVVAKMFDSYRKSGRRPERYDNFTLPTIKEPRYHKKITLSLRQNGFSSGDDPYNLFFCSIVYARFLQIKYYPLTAEMKILKKISCESYRNEVRRKSLELISQKKVGVDLSKCSICGNPPGVCGKGGKLQIHHNDYNDPSNIVVLCYKCHRRVHGLSKKTN